MSPQAKTVRQLAREVGLETDEVLLSLWDAGMEHVEAPDSRVAPREMKRVLRALQIPDPRELGTVAYWQRQWNMTDAEARAHLLEKFDIKVGPNARVLPKGAVKRLRRESILTPAGEEERAPLINEEPEFRWNCRGHARTVEFLTEGELVQIHEALVENAWNSGDPIEPPGVRDYTLLGSAAFRPQTSLAGELKYRTVESAAAALLHSIVHNHAFHNGNKRTGVVGLLVMLDRNDLLLNCNQGELFRFVLRVAQHRLTPKEWSMRDDREVMAINEWIISNSRQIDKGHRPIRWHELRRILTGIGCDIGQPIPGNKVKISRTIQVRNRFGILRNRQIVGIFPYRSAGHELDLATLNWIRRELQIDEEHGYDSGYFYGSDKRQPDEFIAEYRTLLRRLARL
ncbi:MAG: Death-on-curing family protein [Actinomycetota bacterium]|nr:Death-on-curing family protein [Actinomycetota bacterium]